MGHFQAAKNIPLAARHATPGLSLFLPIFCGYPLVVGKKPETTTFKRTRNDVFCCLCCFPVVLPFAHHVPEAEVRLAWFDARLAGFAGASRCVEAMSYINESLIMCQ